MSHILKSQRDGEENKIDETEEEEYPSDQDGEGYLKKRVVYIPKFRNTRTVKLRYGYT